MAGTVNVQPAPMFLDGTDIFSSVQEHLNTGAGSAITIAVSTGKTLCLTWLRVSPIASNSAGYFVITNSAGTSQWGDNIMSVVVAGYPPPPNWSVQGLKITAATGGDTITLTPGLTSAVFDVAGFIGPTAV